MQGKGTVTKTQVCRAGLPVGVTSVVVTQAESDPNTPLCGGKRGTAFLKAHPIRTRIIAHGAKGGLRAGNGASLLLALRNRFECFGGLPSRRYDQLGRQVRVRLPKGLVGCPVQSGSVTLVIVPPVTADCGEAVGKLQERLPQSLLGGRVSIQHQTQRDFHHLALLLNNLCLSRVLCHTYSLLTSESGKECEALL